MAIALIFMKADTGSQVWAKFVLYIKFRQNNWLIDR